MDRFSIEKMTTEHLDQFNELLRYAFQITNKELLSIGWEEDEIREAKSPILEKATVFGWFDGGKLASQIALYPLRVNIHGEIYDMAGVTGVATYPEYAGKGLMKKLISHSLGEMRTKKQSISMLYPYSIPYYRRMGWEIISDKMSFALKDTQLPKPVPVKGHVERVDENGRLFKDLHNTFARARHGALIRDSLAWEEYWRWDVDDILAAIYYNEAKEPMGYLVYLLEDEVLRIKELVYLDEEARHGLWNYISAHFSMVQEVRGNQYTNEPLAFLLEDSEIRESIRPYFMARIVDVEEFLLRYPFDPKGKLESICLHITDPMANWNNGSYSLSWDDEGTLTCQKGAEEGLPITLDVQTLCTMLLSYKRPSYLKRIERIRADEHAIAILEQLIPEEVPYFSDYF